MVVLRLQATSYKLSLLILYIKSARDWEVRYEAIFAPKYSMPASILRGRPSRIGHRVPLMTVKEYYSLVGNLGKRVASTYRLSLYKTLLVWEVSSPWVYSLKTPQPEIRLSRANVSMNTSCRIG